MDLRKAAALLGGDVSGGQVLCPGPGHSRRDRSLAVRFHGDGSFVVYSFADDDPLACRDHVRRVLALREDEPKHVSFQQASRPPKTRGSDDRSPGALRIWHESVALEDSPAWRYLRTRGIDTGALPSGIGGALRWHPRCPWERGTHGCMVALYTDSLTGEPKAIHRTAITTQGEKTGRLALGPKAGCVIRLWPDDAVTMGLVIGEGIETVLGAATRIRHRGTVLQPAWAAGDAGTLARLPVLSGIEALTILTDNDASETGQRAALECSERWTAAGCEVTRLIPHRPGEDFNDIVRSGAA